MSKMKNSLQFISENDELSSDGESQHEERLTAIDLDAG